MDRLKRLSSAMLAGILGTVMPLLGARAATYTPQEQANMKVVADLYQELEQHRGGGLAQLLARKEYIQHSLGPRDTLRCVLGRDGLIRCSQQGPAAPPPRPAAPPAAASTRVSRPPETQTVLALTAIGNIVIRVSSRTRPVPGGTGVSTTYIFNMFRVQDGKLVEHWDGFSGRSSLTAQAGGSPGAAKRSP